LPFIILGSSAAGFPEISASGEGLDGILFWSTTVDAQ